MNKNSEVGSIIQSIIIGANFLGSGGGGSAQEIALMITSLLKKYQFPKIVNPDDIDDNALILPIAFMGSPFVMREKLPSLQGTNVIIDCIRKKYNNNSLYTMAAEIGGGNAFTPLLYAMINGINCIDGDLLGRAFPEISMIATNLYSSLDIKKTAFISNDKGEFYEINNYKSFEELEEKARDIAIQSGSSACIVPHVLTGKQMKEIAIKKTYSLAYDIGNEIKKSTTIDALIKNSAYNYVISGYVSDIKQQIIGGFSIGEIEVQTLKGVYTIILKNEYLALIHNDTVVSLCPDIISLLDYDSLYGINSELLRLGARVHIVTMKADNVWYSEQGKTITQKSIRLILENKGIEV
jgi:DUF917 family protein